MIALTASATQLANYPRYQPLDTCRKAERLDRRAASISLPPLLQSTLDQGEAAVAEAGLLAGHPQHLQLWQRLGDGPYIASALGAWTMLLMMLVILFVNSLLGRRLGALFRI